MTKIDLKDKKILTALDMDARMPLTELAKKVGLSRQVVEYRLKRMQKEHIIFGAIGVFDSVVVGLSWYRITFRLLKITKEQKNEFIQHLKKNKYVLWLGEVGGNWDIIVNFICQDNFKFNTLFEDIIKNYGSYVMDYEILIYVNVYDLEKTHVLSQENERKFFYHEMKYNPEVQLDATDKEIAMELSKNALLTNIELGQKLHISGNTIKNRIIEMRKKRFLLGFRLFTNANILGYTTHMLFLEMTKFDLEKEKELYAYLKTIPNITFLTKHIGRWRIGMEIETKDVEEFQNIFVDIRGRFSDIITNFESFPLFRDHIINYFPEGNL